jgi:hypothetical protein
MKSILPHLTVAALFATPLLAADSAPAPAAKPATPAPAAADQPAKPKLKIIPGQVIVPTGQGEMRRIWGELVSLDPKTRTGKFRNESDDKVMSFTIMPYAELLHHAANGDLQDFRVGERAIFRLHENEAGDWVWLTYIQDQMNMMNGHKEYYRVDKIDPVKGELTVTQMNFETNFVREEGIQLETDKDTRYWKGGEPTKFSDIQVGDRLRTKTHGVGQGKTKVCWEVFLDEASLAKFQSEQKAVHSKRMAEQGAPGYVDKTADKDLQLTMFREGDEAWKTLKAGQKVKIAPAGVDREPNGATVTATVATAQTVGGLGKVGLTLDGPASGFAVAGLARMWVVK